MRRLRFAGALICGHVAAGQTTQSIAGLDAMASKEFGGGERLLARELDDHERDGSLAGGDDQAIGGGFDDFAGVSMAVDDACLVDDQAARRRRCRRYSLPGRLRHGPGLHRATRS